jgi:hypothetical protein
MAAPTVADLATHLRRVENDPELVRVWSATVAWARKELARLDTDDLDDLEDDNRAALLGYAGDLLKLPKATFGMFAPDDIEGLNVVAGDIGARWRPMLMFGHRTRSSFA